MAAALVLVAAWAVTDRVLEQHRPNLTRVVTVTADLPTGHRLGQGDLQVVLLPSAAVPPGALLDPGQADGLVLGAPVLGGEALSTARLHGPGLLQGLPAGQVMTHVPVTDPAVVAVLRPGQRVEALSTVDGTVVAPDLLVLAVADGPAGPGGAGEAFGAPPGATGIFVAATPRTAAALAAAAGPDLPGAGITLAVRAPDHF